MVNYNPGQWTPINLLGRHTHEVWEDKSLKELGSLVWTLLSPCLNRCLTGLHFQGNVEIFLKVFAFTWIFFLRIIQTLNLGCCFSVRHEHCLYIFWMNGDVCKFLFIVCATDVGLHNNFVLSFWENYILLLQIHYRGEETFFDYWAPLLKGSFFCLFVSHIWSLPCILSGNIIVFCDCTGSPSTAEMDR